MCDTCKFCMTSKDEKRITRVCLLEWILHRILWPQNKRLSIVRTTLSFVECLSESWNENFHNKSKKSATEIWDERNMMRIFREIMVTMIRMDFDVLFLFLFSLTIATYIKKQYQINISIRVRLLRWSKSNGRALMIINQNETFVSSKYSSSWKKSH